MVLLGSASWTAAWPARTDRKVSRDGSVPHNQDELGVIIDVGDFFHYLHFL